MAFKPSRIFSVLFKAQRAEGKSHYRVPGIRLLFVSLRYICHIALGVHRNIVEHASLLAASGQLRIKENFGFDARRDSIIWLILFDIQTHAKSRALWICSWWRSSHVLYDRQLRGKIFVNFVNIDDGCYRSCTLPSGAKID